jgi:hypothetical protein
MRIDLHTHSTASDGTDSPAELMAAAVGAGLDAIALTDHDTVAGWDEAAAARPAGLALVRGVELSCEGPATDGGRATVHLLAYLIDPRAPELVAEQARMRGNRRRRLHEMAVRMRADGLPVDPDAVLAAVPETASAGRPHLARALLAAGVVSSVSDAFHRYLHNGGRYYLGKQDMPLAAAVRLVAAAGGVPVLAHCRARRRGRIIGLETIVELVDDGLAGLEVDHTDHEEADRVELRALAERHGLLATGSSDYHGTNKTVRLGAHTTSPEMFRKLISMGSGCPVLS